MTSADDVLTSIDAVLHEHDTFDGAVTDDEFPDAMRWVPPDARVSECDTCDDLGEVRTMVPGFTGEPVEGDVPCPDCDGARPDDFGRVRVGPEVGRPLNLNDYVMNAMAQAFRDAADDRARLLSDLALFGSALVDPTTGRRIPPEDAALVHDQEGRVTGVSIRGASPNYIIYDEAQRLPLTIERPPDDWTRRIRAALDSRDGAPFSWTLTPEQGEAIRRQVRERAERGSIPRPPSDHTPVAVSFRLREPTPDRWRRAFAAVTEAAQQLSAAMRRATAAVAVDTEDVRARALRLRQNRSTGPDVVPFRNRGRNEQRRTRAGAPPRRRRAGQHVHVPPARRR